MKTFRLSPLTATLAVFLGLALLAGCTVGPDYVKPSLDIPAGYKESGQWKPASPLDSSPRGPWWTVYDDAELNRLMAKLAGQNPTIAQAEAQYRQAAALLNEARAGQMPSIAATAAASRGLSDPAGQPAGQYSLGLSASWEADLWGGVRRAIEAGEAKEAGSAAQVAAIRLSTEAQFVSAYLQLVVADRQLQQLQESENSLQQILALTRNQYAAGTVSEASVTAAESQLKTGQAARVQKLLSRSQLEHALAAALGLSPAQLTVSATGREPHLPAIPAGIPSTLLERRPDIAAAERTVMAANAQIGVAQSALYPTLNLSASTGYHSSTLSDLLNTPNRIWSLGPQLAETIFDGGLRRAQTAQAIAAYDASVAAYRQTVLAAFQGVEDNLAAQALLAEQMALQEVALADARRAEEITLNQYRAGTVGYTAVLTAQNSRIAAESSLWAIKNSQYISSVALISSLGGQW